jgi:hypothetical protein
VLRNSTSKFLTLHVVEIFQIGLRQDPVNYVSCNEVVSLLYIIISRSIIAFDSDHAVSWDIL